MKVCYLSNDRTSSECRVCGNISTGTARDGRKGVLGIFVHVAIHSLKNINNIINNVIEQSRASIQYNLFLFYDFNYYNAQISTSITYYL